MSQIVEPHPLLLLPFGLLLGAIAVAPLVIRHHWERHYHWVSVALALVAIGYYALALHAWGRLAHTAVEYVSFLSLIGSLFIVAGGIHIVVRGEARPWQNVLFLLTGALLANVIGTTGASMLLVRPWLRMNRSRFAPFHTVFFIFLVSNIGGCLTPVADPPLFLGYLKGVPFWWVAQHCWPAWLLVVALLLAIFGAVDRVDFRRAPAAVSGVKGCRMEGLHNLFFLALILGAVFLQSPPGLREGLMAAAALGSYLTTPRALHQANAFTFIPVKEVAWLFFGIFATMMPVLDYLERHSAALDLHSEQQYFWLTGALSGVLDNAPTYLAFLASAFGTVGLQLENGEHVRQFLATHGHLLRAVSLGAVFFGATTYLGNGPNLMVKSIIEAAGVRTPDFFRYFYRYSLPVLLPILGLVALLFFSRFRLF